LVLCWILLEENSQAFSILWLLTEENESDKTTTLLNTIVKKELRKFQENQDFFSVSKIEDFFSALS
jgi:hypothetical protein